MKILGVAAAVAALTTSVAAHAQTWTPLVNQPNFYAGTSLLMTDGTVFVHAAYDQNWWKLSPDKKGSYINGTWKELAATPGWGPTYYASDVLDDGRIFVMGGEYNFDKEAESNVGGIYDPVKNKWTTVSPPNNSASGAWQHVGDAPSVVLPNGLVEVGNIYYGFSSTITQSLAILDPKTLKWSNFGNGRADYITEVGFTLLPDGSVLAVNISKGNGSERYLPATDTWVDAGTTVTSLPDYAAFEIGPQILLPDGDVFAIGGTSNTDIFTPPTTFTDPGVWAKGPTIPNKDDEADGPAAVLPSGHVLMAASPGAYKTPTNFYEYDGKKITAVPNPPTANASSSYYYTMLDLPNGQVLLTGQSPDVEVYTPTGSPKSSWRPTIKTAPASVSHGTSDYVITGTQLNGLTSGSSYGDDAQTSSNYPIVRITNIATKDVFYCRSHDFSTMGVATGSKIVSTKFDVPKQIETGASELQVIANGIASTAIAITVN